MSTFVDEAVVTPTVLERRSARGEVLGMVSLDPAIFSVSLNVPLVHQVVTAQLAARRSGTQSTLTRAEVRGGSHKPYRQKGTGNARQGSIRAPHYSGGGVALGPKPRSYAQRTPKKMVQQALRCALSDRARTGGLRLIDGWDLTVAKTKDALAVLEANACAGKVLVVLGREDVVVEKSVANLPTVTTVPADQLGAYAVMNADIVVFTDETLPGTTSTVDEVAKPAPRRAGATKAASEPDSEPALESPSAVPTDDDADGLSRAQSTEEDA